MPGARRDTERGLSHLRKREKGLEKYAEKRRAGEQPDGTTPEAIENYERRTASWERAESELRDSAPAESVEKMRRRTLNVA